MKSKYNFFNGDILKEVEDKVYKIIDKLEFTSERKRMSVVVKFPGYDNYILFTKGAD